MTADTLNRHATTLDKPVQTVLIFGVTGMLGNELFRVLSNSPELNVFGTARGDNALKHFSETTQKNIITGVDINDHAKLVDVIQKIKPDLVINCIGVIKQMDNVDNVLTTVPINTLLPHLLAKICLEHDARLILVSTDCVFSGKKGHYVETDFPDCDDIYGRSKLLGEIDNTKHVVTIRSSIIGHELNSSLSLVDWFLKQTEAVNGFTRAIFSGLPTVVMAEVIRDFIIPNKTLYGLYHVAAQPISKFDLLQLIATQYEKKITINPSDSTVIDRSLNQDRFRKESGFVADAWPILVRKMFESYQRLTSIHEL